MTRFIDVKTQNIGYGRSYLWFWGRKCPTGSSVKIKWWKLWDIVLAIELIMVANKPLQANGI